MSNPIKDIFDIESLSKDIAERENIILNYRYCLNSRHAFAVWLT